MPERTNFDEPGLARVRSVIDALTLAGTISLATTARHLGTSPRTLQRRLKRDGLSFRGLVEESRFEIASALLRRTDIQVQDLAARLGYATPGAFGRAFRKWAGCSPGVHRRASGGSSRGASDWREMGRSPAPPRVG
jgi:AraC-like DNA-binding protein